MLTLIEREIRSGCYYLLFPVSRDTDTLIVLTHLCIFQYSSNFIDTYSVKKKVNMKILNLTKVDMC